MKCNEYRHWRTKGTKNKNIIPRIIDNLAQIRDSLMSSPDSIAYNNAFAIDTVIDWLELSQGVNEVLRNNILNNCVMKLTEVNDDLS